METIIKFKEERPRNKSRRPRRPRKDMTSNRGTNKKMNPEVYKLRRQVMEYIYRAKHLLGGNMDRIDIRIIDLAPEHAKRGVVGTARMGQKIIWIPEDTLKEFEGDALHEIVFHELLHALWAVPHDKKCPLMSPIIKEPPMKGTEIDKIFLQYAKKMTA